jgi:LysM repeat protein
MGFNSQAGQVGFGIQSVKGTAVPATRFARLRSGSLGGDRALLVPDPEIGGNRDVPGAYLGPVTFGGELAFYPRAEMIAMMLYGALGTKVDSSVAGTNEVQTITVTGAPAGGTFKLQFRGQRTAAIPYNATSAQIDTALEALSLIGVGGVLSAGGPLPATPVTATFNAAPYAATNVPNMTVVESALTGGTAPAAVVTASTPGVPAVGTHIITPGNTLPWLSVEERIGNTFESYQYKDAKVNTLHLEADAGGFVMGTANLFALSQVSGFTAQGASAPWDTTPMMVGGEVVVSFGGAVLPANNFALDINNNIETDNFVLGSVFAADATEKRRELTMTCTYRPTDSTLWKNAMYGNAALTSPAAGPAYQGAVSVKITTYETIGDVVAGTPFSVLLEAPNVVITPYKINPSGDDVLSNDLQFTFVRPDAAVDPLVATVVNDLATVS